LKKEEPTPHKNFHPPKNKKKKKTKKKNKKKTKKKASIGGAHEHRGNSFKARKRTSGKTAGGSAAKKVECKKKIHGSSKSWHS